jgi:hypothetical protein
MVTADADTWLDTYNGPAFDLAFIDCRPGKFHRRNDLISHLMYQPRVDRFLDEITTQPGRVVTVMNWASGLAVGARVWR